MNQDAELYRMIDEAIQRLWRGVNPDCNTKSPRQEFDESHARFKEMEK
jgi:hypothetical protein